MKRTISNQILIARSRLDKEPFLLSRSIIWIIEHSQKHGAKGFILNKPINVPLSEIFKQTNTICSNVNILSQPVRIGGAVSQEQGFILEEKNNNSIKISTSNSALDQLCDKKKSNFKLFLGHSSWEPEQLENEIKQNNWLIGSLNTELIFNYEPETLWQQYYQSIGVNPSCLYSECGHA